MHISRIQLITSSSSFQYVSDNNFCPCPHLLSFSVTIFRTVPSEESIPTKHFKDPSTSWPASSLSVPAGEVPKTAWRSSALIDFWTMLALRSIVPWTVFVLFKVLLIFPMLFTQWDQQSTLQSMLVVHLQSLHMQTRPPPRHVQVILLSDNFNKRLCATAPSVLLGPLLLP